MNIKLLGFAVLSVAGAQMCFGEPMVALVSRGEGAVKMMRARSYSLVTTKTIPIGKDPSEMCVDAGEKKLYVGETSAKTISVIDLATQAVTATFSDPDMKRPDGCTVSADGTKLYVVDTGGDALFVFATDSGKMLAKTAVGKGPRRVIISKDGKMALVSNAHGDSLTVIDTATYKVTRTVKTGHEPRELVWTPDGKFLAVTLIVDDCIAYFHADTLELEQQVSTGRSPQRIAFSPDGEVLYSLSRYENAISVSDLTKAGERRYVSSIPVGRYAFNMVMSADGKLIYTANTSIDNTITVVDVRFQKVMNAVPAGNGPGCMLYLK